MPIHEELDATLRPLATRRESGEKTYGPVAANLGDLKHLLLQIEKTCAESRINGSDVETDGSAKKDGLLHLDLVRAYTDDRLRRDRPAT